MNSMQRGSPGSTMKGKAMLRDRGVGQQEEANKQQEQEHTEYVVECDLVKAAFALRA